MVTVANCVDKRSTSANSHVLMAAGASVESVNVSQTTRVEAASMVSDYCTPGVVNDAFIALYHVK